MPGESPSAGYYEVTNIFNPDGPPFSGRISVEWLQSSPPVRQENAQIARDVLREPSRIYQGIDPNRPGYGFAYIGDRAGFPFMHTGKGLQRDGRFDRIPVPWGHLCIVFIGPDKIIYDWRVEACREGEPRRPVRPAAREGVRVWDRP